MTLANTTITADGTGRLITTEKGIPRAFIFCDVASTFGGGTLTLGIRRAGSTDDLMAIDTVIPGDQDVYLVGGLVELHYTLTGSTTPSIEILVSQGL